MKNLTKQLDNQKLIDNSLHKNNELILPEYAKKNELDFEIKKQLKDYPKNDAALKKHSGLYILISFGLMIFGILTMFNFQTNIGIFDAIDEIGWQHIVVGLSSMLAALYCMVVGTSIPIDINYKLNSEDYLKMTEVAKYNPEISLFLKENEDFPKRQYYYHNIDEQCAIIANTKGLATLKDIVKNTTEKRPCNGRLANVEIGKFVPQETILKNAKRWSIGFISAFILCVLIIVFANLIGSWGNGYLRFIMFVPTLVSFFGMLISSFNWFTVKDSEAESVKSDVYVALMELAPFKPENIEYIAQVLKENRPLNTRDLNALNIDRQYSALEYDRVKRKTQNY